MAIEKNRLTLRGSTSSCLSLNDIDMLGKLLATMLYYEIDACSTVLLSFNQLDVERIRNAAYKLSLLCDVILEE